MLKSTYDSGHITVWSPYRACITDQSLRSQHQRWITSYTTVNYKQNKIQKQVMATSPSAEVTNCKKTISGTSGHRNSTLTILIDSQGVTSTLCSIVPSVDPFYSIYCDTIAIKQK